jgi:antitoxin CptB
MTDTAVTTQPDLETRRKRALYRAHHRGTKEMDFLLGRYSDATIPTLVDPELTRFEQFLSIPDPDLQKWFLAPEMLDGTDFADIVRAVRDFHGLA